MAACRRALVKACLFDLDGTLVHSDHIHFKAFRQILKPLGVSINEQDYESIAGRQNEPVLRELRPDLTEDDVNRYSLAKETLFRELALKEIQPVDGLLRLLDTLGELQVPTAIVTNAPRVNVDFMLSAAKLEVYFPLSRQVLGDECSHGKPHPEPYLQGLKLLQAHADDTIAFEDSPAGASAAVAAGIRTVGMLTSQSAATMTAVGCTLTAVDFADKALMDSMFAASTELGS